MDTLCNANTDKSSSRFGLFASIAFAFIVRLGVLVLMPEGLDRDTDAYRLIAETLRGTGTYGFPRTERGEERPDVWVPESAVRPTAYRPPLYPLLLAGLTTNDRVSPFAVGTVNLISGIASVAIVWVIARQWGLGKSATLAALLTACDPILLYQSAQLMTETLATLTAVVALWGLSRWLRQPTAVSAIGAGIAMGLACLCRPTFMPWSGLIVGSCMWIAKPGRNRWRAAALIAFGILLVLLPWGIRNYLRFGQLKFTTTHGGYTLLLGNNPRHYRFLREGGWGRVWDSRELDQAWLRRAELRDAEDDLFGLTNVAPATAQSTGHPIVPRTEFEDDQLAYQLAARYIREDRGTFLYSCLHRIGSLWQLLPRQVQSEESTARRLARWGVAGWYAAIFAFAIRGGWELRVRILRPPWVWGLGLCLAFTAVHTLYWSNMRMRAPVTPVMSLLAAAGMLSCRARRASGRAQAPFHE